MVGFLPSFEAAEYECQWYFAVYTLLSQPPCLHQVCLGKCLTTSSLKTNQNQTTLQKVPSPSAALRWPCRCGVTSSLLADVIVERWPPGLLSFTGFLREAYIWECLWLWQSFSQKMVLAKCVPELFPTPVHSQLWYDDLKLRQFCVWESSLLLLEVITLS